MNQDKQCKLQISNVATTSEASFMSSVRSTIQRITLKRRSHTGR